MDILDIAKKAAYEALREKDKLLKSALEKYIGQEINLDDTETIDYLKEHCTCEVDLYRNIETYKFSGTPIIMFAKPELAEDFYHDWLENGVIQWNLPHEMLV